MEIDEISKFLSPITVGFIAAYLGSKLALEKFKKEKLWDERRSIYKEVIESFEELIHWSEYVRASHCCEPTIEEKIKFDESLRIISKHSVTGGLLLSQEFQETLEKANTQLHRVRFQINEESLPDLNTDRGRDEWLFILSSEIRKVVDEYMPKLISIAKNEIPK